jgi:hypothetical protein
MSFTCEPAGRRHWFRLAPWISLILCLAVAGPAFADIDTYTIDGQPVLLYKIIQWWYDAPGAQAPWICGRMLACRTQHPLDVTFIPDKSRLNICFETEFAELVWPEIAGSGKVRMDLYPTWTDSAYLNDSAPASCPAVDNRSAGLSMETVSPEQAQRWMRSAADLEMIFSGFVLGLAEDRVALVDDTVLIKTCPPTAVSRSGSRAMTLTLRHRSTKQVLVVFSLQPTGS